MLLKMYTYWQECKNITFLKVLIVLVVTVFFFVLVRVTLYPRLEFTGNPNWTNRESFAVKQIIMLPFIIPFYFLVSGVIFLIKRDLKK